MHGLKDFLKKKDRITEDSSHSHQNAPLAVPEFTFIRSTTESQEVIEPPTYPDDHQLPPTSAKERKHSLRFRSLSSSALPRGPRATSPLAAAEKSSQQLPVRSKGERRLSSRLHLHRRTPSGGAESSTILPQDLPEAPAAIGVRSHSKSDADADGQREVKEQREAQWEKRATLLAMNNPLRDGSIQTPPQGSAEKNRSRSPSIADQKSDVSIQEAIRLHEEGDLTRSTNMFGALANPKGTNNTLAQVLYGLALRHGWGIPIEPEKAIHYLSLAASNSASIEEQALASGLKKGGAAKGELVLAIFELANCFRHGWGIKKDAVAGRQYYETAANLGDTDAMEEAAWCYLEGFGGVKDKVHFFHPPSHVSLLHFYATSVPSPLRSFASFMPCFISLRSVPRERWEWGMDDLPFPRVPTAAAAAATVAA